MLVDCCATMRHQQPNGVNEMKTPVDYRIENIREVSFNGKKVKAFDSYVKQGDAFVYQGAYTAPVRTAAKNLWLIPNESDTGTVYD